MGGLSHTQKQPIKETIMAKITQPQGDSTPPDITPISEQDSLKALQPTNDDNKED